MSDAANQGAGGDRRARRRAAARRQAVVQRRRVALVALAALATIAGLAVGAGAGGDPPAEPEATGPACPAEIAGDQRRLAGQMLVVRMEEAATDRLRRAARRGEISGVIVFPADPATGADPDRVRAATRALQTAARRGENPPLLVMVDQEGGGVKRFLDAPPQRSPVQLAEGAPRDSRLEGQATGNFLAGVGINVDLAPVVDVPQSDQTALALRSFGSDPGQVTRLGLAFAAGLEDEGVLAAPKHFPGLGRAEVSTDAAPVTIEASERQLRSDLVPFRGAISRGAEMIMVGLASYPELGADGPAALSPAVVDGLLRDRLGYQGVVVTDDLGAAALSGAGIGPGQAAVAAAGAGADLLLHALGGGGGAIDALVRAQRGGRLNTARLEASCARIVALKQRLAEAEE